MKRQKRRKTFLFAFSPVHWLMDIKSSILVLHLFPCRRHQPEELVSLLVKLRAELEETIKFTL